MAKERSRTEGCVWRVANARLRAADEAVDWAVLEVQQLQRGSQARKQQLEQDCLEAAVVLLGTHFWLSLGWKQRQTNRSPIFRGLLGGNKDHNLHNPSSLTVFLLTPD